MCGQRTEYVPRITGYFRYKIVCLCYVMKNVNKSLFYVGPLLKVISCLIHAWTYIIVILILYPGFNWIILSCTCIYLPCIITINVLTVSFLNNSIITAPTCALITTSWYTKMVKMYNIKLTEHLLYTRILCLFTIIIS